MRLLKLISIFLLSALTLIGSCKKQPKESPPKEPTEKIIEIETDFGNMYMWLYKETPQHRANFLKLASEKYFDSSTFHRIIVNFVIQGGDPNTKDNDSTNDGKGGPNYKVPAEFVDSITHDYGAVGAARDTNAAKASNGSQFYIVVNKSGQHGLDKNYTVFGKIFKGIEVANTIVVQPKNKSTNRPYTNIRMKVRVLEKTLSQLKTEYNFTP